VHRSTVGVAADVLVGHVDGKVGEAVVIEVTYHDGGAEMVSALDHAGERVLRPLPGCRAR
jgi:hypothetical protein